MSRPSRVQRTFALRTFLLVLLLGGSAAGCSPTAPSQPPQYPPPPPGPELTCPSDVNVQSPDGNPLGVSFSATVKEGTGFGGVTVVCTPPSEGLFPIETTTVECKATDTLERTGSCTFPVIVHPPPRLSATRIVAFGNSITEGKGGSLPYPMALQTLLAARYVTQTVTVYNEGIAGEETSDGLSRLSGSLSRHGAEVLLLEEGINDLNSDGLSVLPTVVDNLRRMIRLAQGRGIRVFVGTLLPQRPSAQRGYAPDAVVPANDQIRPMVLAEGAVLVDLWNAFGGVADPYIGHDGLHPNDAGYQKIAETFFSAIRSQLEVSPFVAGTGFQVRPWAARDGSTERNERSR